MALGRSLILSLLTTVTLVAASKKPEPLPPLSNSSILHPQRQFSTQRPDWAPTSRPDWTSTRRSDWTSTHKQEWTSTSRLPEFSSTRRAELQSTQRPNLPSTLPPPPAPIYAEPPPHLERILGLNRGGQRNYRIIYDDDFQYRCLDAMNRKRLWHENTPPLVLGDNFTQYTIDRSWAILSDIADGKREILKGQFAFGESFFWYYDPHRYRTVEEAINTWYEEERNYDYQHPEFSPKTGGFTQLVWKSSREASCIKIEFETQQSFKTLVVANFWPAGNVKGEFAQNVLPIRQTRPDLIDHPSRPMNRPWPRPPYRPPTRPPTTESPSYPTHPLGPHPVAEETVNSIPIAVSEN